jgi:hypothetical protein
MYPFLSFFRVLDFSLVQVLSLKSLTIRRWSLGVPRDIFQAKELFNCETSLLLCGDIINILGGEDHSSQWSKAYS